jgi:delta24-sterol reductase
LLLLMFTTAWIVSFGKDALGLRGKGKVHIE